MNNEIDLHGMTRFEAAEAFIKFYNERVKKRNNNPIEVIHGYGSGGVGGAILKSIRGFLKRNSDCLDYEFGEDSFRLNPGITLVWPKKCLPEIEDILAKQIWDFCVTPKTVTKICGKFRRFGDVKVHENLKRMEQHGLLEILYKNGYKTYIRPED